jgi:hypothetical protein
MARMSFHHDDFLITLVIAAAAAAVAMSFTQGSMFEPLRKWLATKNKLIGELASCFFCMSHWTVFAGVALYQPRPVQGLFVADLVVTAFMGILAAVVFAGLMFAAFICAITPHQLRAEVFAAHTHHQGAGRVLNSSNPLYCHGRSANT